MKIQNLIYLFGTASIFMMECTPKQDTFQGIITAEAGEISPAKVYVTDIDGLRVEPDGDHTHVEYLSKTWCYTSGQFSVSAAPAALIVEIRKGLEFRPVKDTIATPRGVEKTFALERWVDMIEQRYVGGDIHGHYELLQGPAFMNEVLSQMKAEDLPVVTILANENNSVTPHFSGALDTASTNKHKIYVGQEVRDWQMGHLTLIGLSSQVSGYERVGGHLEKMTHPHWLMHHAMLETHRQRGLVVWSHFSNLPGAESPIAIALGQIDAIELMTFNEPTDLPSHWGPWNNSGMSQATFTVMRGVDLYYQYLNAGFRLPIVAGTDKMKNDIPIGSNRYYAELNDVDRYKSWIAGIRDGNGFITNGPMLEFTVDTFKPGDSVDFTGARIVHAHVAAKSILPFATLEIIRNGDVVGHKTVFVKDNPAVDGIYTLELDTVITLNESSWIAARVADDPDNRNRILPRGLSVFAHTNPVFFYKDNKLIREEDSIAYLSRYVQGVINWLNTKPEFVDPDDQIRALKLAKKALTIYDGL